MALWVGPHFLYQACPPKEESYDYNSVYIYQFGFMYGGLGKYLVGLLGQPKRNVRPSDCFQFSSISPEAVLLDIRRVGTVTRGISVSSLKYLQST